MRCSNCYDILVRQNPSNSSMHEEQKRSTFSNNHNTHNNYYQPEISNHVPMNHNNRNYANQNVRSSHNHHPRGSGMQSHHNHHNHNEYMNSNPPQSYHRSPINYNRQMRSNPNSRYHGPNRVNSDEDLYSSNRRLQPARHNHAQRPQHYHHAQEEADLYNGYIFDPFENFESHFISPFDEFDNFFRNSPALVPQNRGQDFFSDFFRPRANRGLSFFDSFSNNLFENFINNFQNRLPAQRSRRHRERNLLEMLLGEFSNLESFDLRPMHRFVQNQNQQVMDITELLAAMASMHPQGQRPANPSNVRNLATVKMTADIIRNNTTCTVCQEDFKIGENARKLACDHYFHEDCLMPWLQVQNTCPSCRNPV
ncbi:hypothetical protein SteCoe_17791 [Stentor coeruleus]|uniref:RING-type domain-containing protein n=1 Tax=Stentor coeruleus TaxID=5963 RepID=A0A1R2BXZ7_9CILI|nr:hypothetical protein SteCoe_17791 [Stentor coeruleus]